jgi:hypothetical protein
MKEQFIHLRLMNRETKEILPYGGYTFCYIPFYGNSENSCTIGVSKCSILDSFNKKIGRAISRGRAVSFTDGFVHFVNEPLNYDQLNEIAMKIALDDLQVQAERHGFYYGNIDVVSTTTKSEVAPTTTKTDVVS